jgi:nitrogen regulatory protein PII
MGTASSEVLKAFGLSGTKKTFAVCIVPEFKIDHVMTAVAERLELIKPGKGIIFIAPIVGVSAALAHLFDREFNNNHQERFLKSMSAEESKTPRAINHELIVAVVNSGFSDAVMDAARANGARGGTIIQAKRAGDLSNGKFLGITLQDDKEIVTILTQKERGHDLMRAISHATGMKSEAHGIVFAIPIEDLAGVALGNSD